MRTQMIQKTATIHRSAESIIVRILISLLPLSLLVLDILRFRRSGPKPTMQAA